MSTTENYDICVIGAGSAGLSVAAGAAQLGARTILFERAEMGGDCLNYGCVPSKALLAAAHAAHDIRKAKRFGIRCPEPEIDFATVMAHVKNVIAAIAPHDSVERFEGLGVRVVKAEARFAGPREVSGGGVQVRARRIVIAAGSTAVIPAIPGIDTVAPLTNETIFSLTTLPEHLVIIGGGPIGVEMAQGFRRLGSRVTVLEARRILERDEPEFSGTLRRQLSAEGIVLREGARIDSVAKIASGIALTLSGGAEQLTGTHLLVAAGRRPRLEGLDLEKAGVAYTAKGIP
ncbi:MAG: FAD-dependent oxidoreductase, partial [Pseudomonadota bacterium]|nr:FAD-dependent oxidoreductase [Pseudomonadota bacterium]